MALTVTRIYGPVARGDRFETVTEIAFDSSFAAGGEALTKADLGFASTVDPEFNVTCTMAGGYVLDYDHTTSELYAYMQTDSDNDLPLGAADTKDLSLLTARVTATGKYRA